MRSKATGPSAASNHSLLIASIVTIVGFLTTTLAQPRVLMHIPLQNLLKNVLHTDRSANAAFFFWVGLPWYIKPLLGILSDAVPIFGSRRKSYILIGALAATAAWFSVITATHSYSELLVVCMIANLATVVASTALGGYMVEAARATSGAGHFTSLRNFAMQFSYLVAGPAGGFLGTLALGWTALACGGTAFLIVPFAWWLVRESYYQPAPAGALLDMGQALRVMVRARTVWAAAAVAALFYLAPGLNTALFYLQQNSLHLNTQDQGHLVFLNAGGGMLAAALYGFFGARRFPLRTLLRVCLLLSALAPLGYLFYDSYIHAQTIEAANGFGGALGEIAVMHLAVRATPTGSEALGFAVLMAVRNFFMWGSDWLGSALIESLHMHFNTLVYINAGATLLVVPLALVLPKVLVSDADHVGSTA
jgi:MFS family permease